MLAWSAIFAFHSSGSLPDRALVARVEILGDDLAHCALLALRGRAGSALLCVPAPWAACAFLDTLALFMLLVSGALLACHIKVHRSEPLVALTAPVVDAPPPREH